MIRFHCLECGMLIQANDSAVGRAAKCPGCGAVLEIPQASFPALLRRPKQFPQLRRSQFRPLRLRRRPRWRHDPAAMRCRSMNCSVAARSPLHRSAMQPSAQCRTRIS